ncbi:hypothetical protein LINGRAHAP2_LOCUS33478 [Linum grandiflorum]
MSQIPDMSSTTLIKKPKSNLCCTTARGWRLHTVSSAPTVTMPSRSCRRSSGES